MKKITYSRPFNHSIQPSSLKAATAYSGRTGWYYFFLLALFFTANIVLQANSHDTVMDELFAPSWFSHACQTCMRTISDQGHNYDCSTATDLYIGRLVRLHAAMHNMAKIDCKKRALPPEDLHYLRRLIATANHIHYEKLSQAPWGQNILDAIEKIFVDRDAR